MLQQWAQHTIGLFVILLIAGVASGQTYQSRINSYGLALPKSNVIMRANLDSRIQEVHVREGQFVQAGELLVELNCDEATAKQEIARLSAEESGPLLNAQAELKFADYNLQKQTSLSHRNAVSKRELNEAWLRFESAGAQLKAAIEANATNQARLKLADAELENHFLRAPFKGQIVEVHVSIGSAVTTNTDVLQIIDSDHLRVDLYLATDETAGLNVGDVKLLEIREPFAGQKISGKVVFCSPLIEPTSGARRITLEIDNRELKLPAGFTVALAKSEPVDSSRQQLNASERHGGGGASNRFQ